MSSQHSVFPLTPTVDPPEPEPLTVDLFAEEGRRMLDALGSETARAILTALAEEPATTSTLADEVDTSLQNAHYHLEQLADAGLVRVVGTHYSERGTEMDVYAPAHDPLVLVGGDDRPDVAGGDADAPAGGETAPAPDHPLAPTAGN